MERIDIIPDPAHPEPVVGSVVVRVLPGTEKYQLVKDFYAFGFRVPAGFIYDGGSVPEVFQWVLERLDGRSAAGVTLHDWLYNTQIIKGWVGKWLADAFLTALFYKNGLPLWKCITVWLAVRLFGGRSWRKDGQNLINPSSFPLPEIKR